MKLALRKPKQGACCVNDKLTLLHGSEVTISLNCGYQSSNWSPLTFYGEPRWNDIDR
jgi:hypothetical protein